MLTIGIGTAAVFFAVAFGIRRWRKSLSKKRKRKAAKQDAAFVINDIVGKIAQQTQFGPDGVEVVRYHVSTYACAHGRFVCCVLRIRIRMPAHQ